MLENKSVSAWENEVKSYGATLGVDVSKSQVQKIAKRFQKLNDAAPLTAADMFELFKHYVYGDPTGEAAVKNVQKERNAAAASRRVAA